LTALQGAAPGQDVTAAVHAALKALACCGKFLPVSLKQLKDSAQDPAKAAELLRGELCVPALTALHPVSGAASSTSKELEIDRLVPLRLFGAAGGSGGNEGSSSDGSGDGGESGSGEGGGNGASSGDGGSTSGSGTGSGGTALLEIQEIKSSSVSKSCGRAWWQGGLPGAAHMSPLHALEYLGLACARARRVRAVQSRPLRSSDLQAVSTALPGLHSCTGLATARDQVARSGRVLACAYGVLRERLPHVVAGAAARLPELRLQGTIALGQDGSPLSNEQQLPRHQELSTADGGVHRMEMSYLVLVVGTLVPWVPSRQQ
jgi:hypothetical protein